MSTTGTTLRTACHVVIHFGLADPDHPHYAMPDGRLTPLAAIHLAATGHTSTSQPLPDPFHTDPDQAKQLMRDTPTTWDAIRWAAAVTPTTPDPDTATGLPDLIDHLDTWAATPDPFTGRRPNTSDVIALLARAAHAADTLTHTLPTQRAAA
ncbi:hypothetical protein [Streptomyces sp. NPDC101145]|uniref:hypothetical protein n=1 Tax=Streptomyces sp. NPDC101145 TaxID=3366112 RepID=UPI003825D18B